MPVKERLDCYKRNVEGLGDAAALVEAVRHCHQTGEKVPRWVVYWLEDLLTEFVALTAPPKTSLQAFTQHIGVLGPCLYPRLL